jgi:hypothetical protein
MRWKITGGLVSGKPLLRGSSDNAPGTDQCCRRVETLINPILALGQAGKVTGLKGEVLIDATDTDDIHAKTYCLEIAPAMGQTQSSG